MAGCLLPLLLVAALATALGLQPKVPIGESTTLCERKIGRETWSCPCHHPRREGTAPRSTDQLQFHEDALQ